MKKIFSLIIAIALIASLCIIPSFAEGGMAHPDRENLAYEAYVETWDEGGANSNFEMPDWFSKEDLVDGRLDAFDGDQNNFEQSLAWYTVSDARNTDITAVVELSKTYKIGEVYLYPTKFLDGQPTPATFTVDISTDGENWINIGGESKLRDGVMYSDPFVYNGEGQEGAYVRIHITRTSSVSDGKYYAGFGELEVYEYVEPPLNVRDFNAETDKQYFDRILINGDIKAEGNDAVAALKANVDGSDGSINTIGMYGWFGIADPEAPVTDNIVRFGYIIDDQAPVFNEAFSAETEAEVLSNNGLRYSITVDVSGLNDGAVHVIKGCLRLANNDLVIFNRENREAIINYKAPLVVTPEPTDVPTVAPTDAPENTAAPGNDATAAPGEDPTEEPKNGGCGGFALSGTAFIALAFGAVLLMKRKKDE